MSAAPHSASRPTQVGLHLLATAATLRRVLDEDMARCGGSLAQSRLLKVLERTGELTQARLADELGLAPRSVTQSVVAMEKAGLVRRTSDDADRRVKVVSMTAAGRRALLACDTDGDALMAQVFAGLPPDQLEVFDDLLGRVAQALSEREDQMSAGPRP